MSGNTDNMHLRPVAVIVPVYRNLEVTRNCLESLMTSDLPEHATIIVIDDNSPEDAVSAYCQELTERSSIQLVVNGENLGFVGSANKGFILGTDADIILLNSDTVVSNDWVQRLQTCAYREDNIGTVTPFSNNGTICSYPVFPISNSIPKQWNARELDRAFESGNCGLHCEIPTAVGFCMYIKRSCLNATGTFDEETFGHGYGEECDFSLRASARGWKHVIAADVFVYHEGAASFASESTDRKSLADKIINDLHPNYHELVSSFIARDPLYLFRRNVDAIRLNEKPADATNILEEHFRYTRTILDRAEQERRSVRDEQEQRQQLETMLACARQQFAETDSALTDAQAIVTRLNSYLEQSQTYSKQLIGGIRTMEQSRSWRYTAWLRKK
jgi:GT2 family glycosyltransferase